METECAESKFERKNILLGTELLGTENYVTSFQGIKYANKEFLLDRSLYTVRTFI
jgi:hypothetical protein